jgi:hypothetical protein
MPFDPSYSKMLRGLSNDERNTGKRHPRSLGINDSKRTVEPFVIRYTQNLWMGPISVGTPAVEFNVIFDTGCGDLFLATIGYESGLVQTLYNPFRSYTALPLSRNFDIHFIGGSRASGRLWTDTVRIGHLTAIKQTLGAASEWNKADENPADGLIGLGFQSVIMDNAVPVFQNLVDQLQTDFSIFAMKLAEGDGVLTLGGMTKKFYKGAITYVDVIDPGRWIIKCDSLSVDGQVIIGSTRCDIDSASGN